MDLDLLVACVALSPFGAANKQQQSPGLLPPLTRIPSPIVSWLG